MNKHFVILLILPCLFIACSEGKKSVQVDNKNGDPIAPRRTEPRPARFFEADAKVHNVVYLIDRSGSMIDVFDGVRAEIKRSIHALAETQNFHVIFYNEEEPKEYEGKKLVPASSLHKKNVSKFLAGVIPCNQTEPIDGLKRAFKVLKDAGDEKNVIFFLTDGTFPDNEAVLSEIRKLNKDKKISIFTYLYGSRPPEAVELLMRIADENDGVYSYIKHPF
jgi:uncharacterized protein with von Willebrand factor type A (vWA) domain